MLVIDRFEGDSAVCVDDEGNTTVLDRGALTGRVREGAVLAEADGGYAVDEEATKARRKKMRERLDRLFES